MNVETDAMRWFQQVADGVTVTEVSQVEGVTQSGVSRALARLESELGTALLHRSGRRLRMTKAGAAFKYHVDGMLHQLDDGLAAVHQLIDPETGTVTLAFHLSLGTWLVPDLISSFNSQHPGVRFELEPVGDERTTSVYARADVDLELSTVRPVDPAVRWTSLAHEPVRLAVARGHHLAHRSRIRLHEASTEAFIALRPTSMLRRLQDDLCGRSGFRAAVLVEADDLLTVTGLVAAGLGVAIVPAMLPSASDVTSGPVRYLDLDDPGAGREIGLAWSTERRLLPAASLFRTHVLDRAAARRLPSLPPGATKT